MTILNWNGKPMSEDGVTERRFDLKRGTDIISGILWTPAQQEQPVPLVLMGHGGSSHKRGARQQLLGQKFAKTYQIASAAIDGPFHGDRASAPLEPHEYQEKIMSIGVDKVTDGMIDDWRTTLDAISQLDTINADRVAYFGLSMGTRFGPPFVAAVGDRLRCTVLGKNGMRAPAKLNMASRFTRDAPKAKVPVFFHMQWDDELFPREGQFELFDLLGTRDKRLLAFPGSHSTTAPEAIDAWCEFIACHALDIEEKTLKRV